MLRGPTQLPVSGQGLQPGKQQCQEHTRPLTSWLMCQSLATTLVLAEGGEKGVTHWPEPSVPQKP